MSSSWYMLIPMGTIWPVDTNQRIAGEEKWHDYPKIYLPCFGFKEVEGRRSHLQMDTNGAVKPESVPEKAEVIMGRGVMCSSGKAPLSGAPVSCLPKSFQALRLDESNRLALFWKAVG